MTPNSLPVKNIGEVGVEIRRAAGEGPQPQRDAEEDRAGGDGGDDRLQPAEDDDQRR